MKLKLSTEELTNKVHSGQQTRLHVGRNLFLNIITSSLAIWHYSLSSAKGNKMIEIGRFEKNDDMKTSLKNAIQNAQECKNGKFSKFIISTKVKQTLLSTENIEDIFIACRNNPDLVPEDIKIGYFLMLVLGIKQTDLHSAKWENICFKSKLFNLYMDNPMARNFSIPIPTQVIPIFERLKELSTESEYLFPNKNRNNHGHMSSNEFRLHLLRLFGKSSSKKNIPNNLLSDMGVAEFRIYDLRRTCAALMHQLNVSAVVVAKCFNVCTAGTFESFIDDSSVNERREIHELLANLILPISLYEYVSH
ncbi:MAG: hypothetical protein QMC62_02140 [Alteromonadaceae bacterium]